MQIAIERQIFRHIARIGLDDTCNSVATTTTANRLIGIAVDADIDGFLVEIDFCGNIGCFGVQLDEVTENIFAIASSGWTIIDTQTFTIKGNYFFSKEDPEGMGQYESVYTPLLQGDYFTFIGSKHKEYGGIGWIGIFDYKARKLVWEYELLPFEERKATRNRLVAPQPLYMSGNKLYIKDIKDNLHIFEREDI